MKEISINEVQLNPITMFGRDWCLACAGSSQKNYNAMTIAWGQLGAVWDRKTCAGKVIIPSATIFIRPQRYTKAFLDHEEYFSICTFDKKWKKALVYMGTHSGRTEDKAAMAGLTPVFSDHTTWFKESEMIFICRKLYSSVLHEKNFVDPKLIEDNYPNKDFHEVYTGEIVKVIKKE